MDEEKQQKRAEELILGAVRNANQSLTIEEIAEKCRMHRVTASKYLAVLEAKGFIVHRSVGKAKLFSLTPGVKSGVRI